MVSTHRHRRPPLTRTTTPDIALEPSPGAQTGLLLARADGERQAGVVGNVSER